MKIQDFLLAITVTFIWGINFSFIKLGLVSLDPFMLIGWRFLLCALPLVFFIKKPNVKMIYIISYGLLIGVGTWGMAALGIYFGISAGIASLVLQIAIFFTGILSYFILGDTLDISKKIAFILASIGIGLILTVTDGSVTYLGLFFVLVGAFSWAITNIIIKKAKVKEMFAFIVWSSLFSPIPLFILAYFMQGETVYLNFFQNLNKEAIFSIIFQVYPTTLLGYWIWNSLLMKYPSSTVVPLTLLVPIFGLLGSSIIFNETINNTKIIACSIIICSLAVNTFGSKYIERIKQTL